MTDLTPPAAASDSTAYAVPVGPTRSTNTLAIFSLVLGLFVAPAGIVTGHIALVQIKRSGEGGRGLALAGTILGYALTMGVILYWLVETIRFIVIATNEGIFPFPPLPL